MSGILARADSKHGASHLNARPAESYMEWLAAAYRGFIDRGLSLDHDAIFQLPALGFSSLPQPNGVHSKLLTKPYHLQDITIRARARPIADAHHILMGAHLF